MAITAEAVMASGREGMRPVPHLDRSVRGRVVLVTGAASGMGRSTAILFAREGARVAVTDVTQEGVDAVVAEIRAEGGEAEPWLLDVADFDAVRRVVGEMAETFGGIDIIVNNAGISRKMMVEDAGYEDYWHRCIAILLTAQQHIIRTALPYLERSDAPRIINISSTEALGASAGFSAYSAAKGGVIGLTRSFAIEFGRRGITVNCVCPGPIVTGMTVDIAPEDRATFARRRTALRRYGDPVEVAHVILSLALPAASYITGAVIPVDGGLSTRHA